MHFARSFSGVISISMGVILLKSCEASYLRKAPNNLLAQGLHKSQGCCILISGNNAKTIILFLHVISGIIFLLLKKDCVQNRIVDYKV